jgi:transposase
MLEVNPGTVYRWCQLYEHGGVKSIRIRKRGRPTGACRKLTIEQEKQLQRLIRDKQPDQLKLPFALWSRIAVQQLIKQLWAMRMPIRTVGEYLKRWGFTPQKPYRRAYEQNPKKVKQWLEERYPAVVKRAKHEDAEIHWADETGLCNGSYYGRSYAPRGKTPAIRLPAKPQRINLISTVTNQGSGKGPVYGLPGYHERQDADSLYAATDQGRRPQGVFDRRQPESTSQQAGSRVAGTTL